MLELGDLNPNPSSSGRGMSVHKLVQGTSGGMAQLVIAPGASSQAVYHEAVEELWFVVEGHGHIWRAEGNGPGQVDDLKHGRSFNIPAGTRFQFKCNGPGPLRLLGVTMPPWPDGTPQPRPTTSRW